MEWEYKVVNTRKNGVPLAGDKETPYHLQFEAGLDEFGKAGWELCGVTHTYLIFKRPTVSR